MTEISNGYFDPIYEAYYEAYVAKMDQPKPAAQSVDGVKVTVFEVPGYDCTVPKDGPKRSR